MFIQNFWSRLFPWVLLALTIIASVALIVLNNQSSTLPWFLTYGSIFLVISGFLAVLVSFMNSVTNRISDEVKIVRESLEEYKPTTTEAIDEKKEQFLNIPNISFHFANKDEIASFYNDYFKEPMIEQIVSEITGEITGEAKANIPQVLETKLGGKDVSKWISTMKLPDISIAEKFRRYQREIIRNGQVTLGLELVDIDLSDLGTFEDLISKLKSNFDLQLDETQVEKQRAILKKKAAEKTILRLENATDWMLMEGKFTISEVSSEFYKCIYKHPVSEYLMEEGKQITISIILRKDTIETSIAGNYAQSIGRSIPLKVYGKVWQPVDRNGDVWELQITPLAIY